MNPWDVIGWGVVALIAAPIALLMLVGAGQAIGRVLSGIEDGIHRHPAVFIIGLTVLIAGAVMVAIQVAS